MAGYVAGGIPVRNLWLLMLYASDLYRHLGKADVAVEESPDDVPDLVARILADLVERRLRKNLSLGYVRRERDLDRVRGRIDVLRTERGALLSRGKVACRYEELTVDTVRNRYVRAALYLLSQITRRPDLRSRCRSLAGILGTMGVSSGRPAEAEISAERLGRHDVEDATMLAAARLAFDLALPTEVAGPKALLAPDRDVRWLRRLFEKAVAGFYAVSLDAAWRVRPGKTMRWPVESATPGLAAILPTMKTDVTLDNHSEGRRIVIDTKFNQIVAPGAFGEEGLRSGYVYQIYAYARALEGTGDPFAATTTGVLLHPSVGTDYLETARIHGHELRFMTVDLGASAASVRTRLLALIEMTT